MSLLINTRYLVSSPIPSLKKYFFFNSICKNRHFAYFCRKRNNKRQKIQLAHNSILVDQEKELIIALRQGDEKAFNTLYKQYWKQVYNFCRLYLTNTEEAKEVVQDVFVRIWQSRDLLRENDNFKGLLFIITRNLVFNQTRKSFNHDFYTLSLLEALENMPEENGYDIEKELEAKELSDYIDLLITELPPQRQKIFNLSRKEHKSYKEIADLMHLSEKTVEHQVSSALKYLRKHITILLIFLN